MGITVFRNGSLARERVRDRWGLSWEGFSAALASTPPGNGGAMMLPWFEPEITPQAPAGVLGRGLDGRPAADQVRAVVEAQMLAMARHSAWMGIRATAIAATGGAAANREILQVMADVFDAPVHWLPSTGSAATGAALRAWQADTGLPWAEVIAGCAALAPVSRVMPVQANVETYRALQSRYRAFEHDALIGDSTAKPRIGAGIAVTAEADRRRRPAVPRATGRTRRPRAHWRDSRPRTSCRRASPLRCPPPHPRRRSRPRRRPRVSARL